MSPDTPHPNVESGFVTETVFPWSFSGLSDRTLGGHFVFLMAMSDSLGCGVSGDVTLGEPTPDGSVVFTKKKSYRRSSYSSSCSRRR